MRVKTTNCTNDRAFFFCFFFLFSLDTLNVFELNFFMNLVVQSFHSRLFVNILNILPMDNEVASRY